LSQASVGSRRQAGKSRFQDSGVGIQEPQQLASSIRFQVKGIGNKPKLRGVAQVCPLLYSHNQCIQVSEAESYAVGFGTIYV
jgi:hypothetical protein